jgi:DNA-3-methyladenine glycosylase I
MSKKIGKARTHSAPWDCVLAKEEEGECRAGGPPETDQGYFEILCLCMLQAGLNWASIRKHWPKYREGFHGFRTGKLARSTPEELLARPGVIKNQRKIEAVIHNAKEFKSIAGEHGSFDAFLETLRPLPKPEQIKALTTRFKHVGPETANYFLHSVGFLDLS